ncbi:MAG: hypothetical protein QNJ69_09290 [Gammaproteobacteria bacterium]|nr:hypothetical protein [Gammaproteobacteria bacterium]
MRLIESEGLPGPTQVDWIIALLVSISLLLTVRSMALPLSPLVLMLAGLLMPLTAMLMQWIRIQGRQQTSSWLLLIILGYLGLLLGVQLDFGAPGLLILATWCSSYSDSGLVYLWGKLTIAPCSHLGMMLGCNLALLMHCQHKLNWQYIVLCNIGMLGGMLLVEIWQPVFAQDTRMLAIVIIIQMMAAMLLGMAAIAWLMRRRASLRAVNLPILNGVTK